MHCQCDTHGVVDSVLLDGYNVGGRLLEGVMFVVRVVEGAVVVEWPSDDPYTSQINQDTFLPLLTEEAQTTDFFACSVPGCTGDAYMESN